MNIEKYNLSDKKLKDYVDSMQYAFNESVEANKKERENMIKQIVEANKSIFKNI